MIINKLKLENFRNYDYLEIEFNKNINIIYGNNAQGKTNILESIFLCSYGKSFRTNKDSELVNFTKDYYKVNIDYEKKDRKGNIEAIYDNKKTFSINGVKQTKISDIVGKINTVIFTPDDIELVKEGPYKRRKFLDMMISSLRPNYINLLNNYNKVLEERNNYLRQIKYENKNKEDLEIWDIQLAEYANKIYEYRNIYIEKIKNIIQEIHNKITKSGIETIKIKYNSSSQNKEKLLKELLRNRENDILKGYTTIGIHRDDFLIYINDKLVSTYGSQGQQRTIILTLKLCELNIIKEEIGESPILLLDDFMSELDQIRRNQLLNNIEDCQIIITCTDDIDIKNSKKFYIEEGKCKTI